MTHGRAIADASAGASCVDAAGKPCGTKYSAALYLTVPTAKSRAELSEFLRRSAQRAAKARDWAKAIPLYQALVVARGPGSAEAKQLALLWTLAGQNERAAEVWGEYAAAASDPAEQKMAASEATRLGNVLDPFADKLVLTEQTGDARRAFALGRQAFAARQYGDALVYFHIGYALAPELPGFLRELGSTYDKLGADKPKREFYRRYLVQRPFGANADVVRTENSPKTKTMLRHTEGPSVEFAVYRAVDQSTARLPAQAARYHGLAGRGRQLQGSLLQSQARDGAIRICHCGSRQTGDPGVPLGDRREPAGPPVRPDLRSRTPARPA